MRISLAFCASLLCLASPLGASPLGSGPASTDVTLFRRYSAAEPTLRKAIGALQSRKTEEARKLLDTCLQQVPDHFEAHFLLARMDYDDRQYAKALDHVETAEKALADLKRDYARAAEVAKANDEAEERAVQDSLAQLSALGVTKNSCMGSVIMDNEHHLALLEAKKGELFGRRNPFEVPAEYRFLQGTCLYRMNRFEEAAAQYKLAIQTDPTHAKAWNNLINIYWLEKDGAQARECLSSAEAKGVVIQPGLKEAVLALPQGGH